MVRICVVFVVCQFVTTSETFASLVFRLQPQKLQRRKNTLIKTASFKTFTARARWKVSNVFSLYAAVSKTLTSAVDSAKHDRNHGNPVFCAALHLWIFA